MCGRILRTSPRETIAAHFDVAIADGFDWTPHYNVAPSQPLLAVVEGDGARSFAAFRWGFVPHDRPVGARGPQPINARAETAAGHSMFRDAFHHRRCLVVADGFYEWQARPGGKLPHVIRLRLREPFAIAGLWEPANDGSAPTALVLTCPPNELIAPVHNRMPVILAREAWAPWLASATRFPELRPLLAPFPSGEMEATPVSTAVNNPGNDGPECLGPPAPIPADAQGSLFGR